MYQKETMVSELTQHIQLAFRFHTSKFVASFTSVGTSISCLDAFNCQCDGLTVISHCIMSTRLYFFISSKPVKHIQPNE